MRTLILLAAILTLALVAGATGSPTGANAVEITEWQVPWKNTRPRDPYMGNGDQLWFVGQRDDYLGLLHPGSGEMSRINLPEGTGPHNLIVENDGTLWVAGNALGYIGHFNPVTGELKRIPMPDPEALDPHTLVFDHAGNIWFTLQGSAMVGRLNMTSEKIDLIRVPGSTPRPYGITIAPDGHPWIALFGTNKLATVDPATLALSTVDLPRPSARPRRLEATSDGVLWYVDYRDGYLGRLDPKGGDIREWRLPSGARSRPYGMAVDGKNRLWIVETGPNPNRFIGFDTRTLEFIDGVDIPSGGGTVRHMMYHAPSNSVWFGTDANTIGRAKLD